MPASHVRRLAASYFETEDLYGCVSPNSDHANHLIAEVMRSYGVSKEAARVRLIKLHLIGADPGPSLFHLPSAA